MTEPLQATLVKASRALHAAKSLLSEGNPDFAASRAYYAMFYAVEALLVSQGLRFRKHGSVHAAFGEYFIKTNVMDPKFHRWLLDAFDLRILGDYEAEAPVSAEEVVTVIAQAEEFISTARRHLGMP